MVQYRRTSTISSIGWEEVFRAYEQLHAEHHVRIDPSVPQWWWEQNHDEIGRRLGACWVYGDNMGFDGRQMYRDEVLAELGIHLGYEEVPE